MEIKIETKPDAQFCDTCLANDRNVSTFTHDTAVFSTLIRCLDHDLITHNSLRICWECSSLIRKFIKFKKQAMLALFNSTQTVTMSQLQTSKMTHENIEPAITETDSKVRVRRSSRRHKSLKKTKLRARSSSSSSVTLGEIKRMKWDVEVKRECETDDVYADTADGVTCDNDVSILEDLGVILADDKSDEKRVISSRYFVYTMSPKEMSEARDRERGRQPYISYLFKCDGCIMSFPNEVDYKAHTRMHHTKRAGTEKCNICTHYLKKDSLPKHLKEHLNLYICKYCSERCPESHGHNHYSGECGASFINRKWIHKHCSNHNFHRKNRPRDPNKPVLVRTKREKQYTVHVMSEEEMRLARDRERARLPFLKNPFQCEICVLSYPRQCQYDEHMVQHTNRPKRIRCDVCTRYVKESLYIRHREEHYNLYTCNVCARECCASHERRQYAAECTASYVNHTWIGKHVLNEHRDEKYVCKICGKISRRKIQHEVHVGRHTTYDCPVCQKPIKGPHYLDRHIKNCHREWRWEDTYCAECDKQFRNMYVYRQHLKTNKRHVTERDMKYLCPHCPKRCSKSSDLKEHVNRVHIRIPTYECDRCEEKYVTKKQLETHIKKVHLNWKPPRDKICPVCNKAFTATTTLKKHMYIHTGERPYRCKLCPATFTQSGSMHTHVKLVHLKLRKVTRESKSIWESKDPNYGTLAPGPTTSAYHHNAMTTVESPSSAVTFV